MRFTHTGRSATVHLASSSGLAQSRDRVRSFGGNNTTGTEIVPQSVVDDYMRRHNVGIVVIETVEETVTVH